MLIFKADTDGAAGTLQVTSVDVYDKSVKKSEDDIPSPFPEISRLGSSINFYF